MSDIVERLADHEWVPLVKEAKAEIDRLNAEKAELLTAIKRLVAFADAIAKVEGTK